jgi:hypothetical protein
MSIFNPDQFLAASVTTAHDTKIARVPDGIYDGQVKKLEFRTLEASADNPERTIMEVIWSVLDPKVKEITGIEEPTVRQSIWLDLGPTGALLTDKGKNVGLGKLREALGQNKQGKAWAPSHLVGGRAKISVKGVTNKKDGEIYAQVEKVAHA